MKSCLFFFFNDTATTEIYTLSLHDALPISEEARPRGEPGQGPRAEFEDAAPRARQGAGPPPRGRQRRAAGEEARSEEHTSELQSPCNIVCRLLLEKKKNIDYDTLYMYSEYS